MVNLLEINGLNHNDVERICLAHADGCGKSVRVGDVLKLLRHEMEFTEEVFIASRYETLNIMAVKDLKAMFFLLKPNGRKSQPNKEAWINEILVLEGEQHAPREQRIEIRNRTESVMKAVFNEEPNCFVGYLARAFLFLNGDALHGKYVRVIRLKNTSESDAERIDSFQNGGVAVVQLVTMQLQVVFQ